MWLSYKLKIEHALSSSTTGTNPMAPYFRLWLSLDDSMELYNKTFASNGNQLTLQRQNIVTKVIKNKPSTDNIVTEKVEDTAQTSTLESSSFVDVELGGTDGTNNDNDNDDVDKDDDDDVVLDDDDDNDVDGDVDNDVDNKEEDDNCDIDDGNDGLDEKTTTTTTTSLRLYQNQEKNQREINANNGTCIICLEEFVTNDIIVRSANSSCHHIYHKTCIVQYLSSNAQHTSKHTRLFSDDNVTRIPVLYLRKNPCPTCRREYFCTIRVEAIIQHYSSQRGLCHDKNNTHGFNDVIY